MLVSVVVTILNEERNIGHLIDHLLVQEAPFEIVIVDAGSTDRTVPIVVSYTKRYRPLIRLFHHGGSRGEGRNYGVAMARGDVVAFTDGDCIPNPFWLKEFRKALHGGGADIVAGRSVPIGYAPFEDLGRIELLSHGIDVTYPSCNLAYRTRVFHEIEGFDPWFMTAEDIDLNLRAVERGYHLAYNPKATIIHRTRSTVVGFLKQAFWNGYGRKQLTLKHGRMWNQYRPGRMFQGRPGFWWFMRMACAVLGYWAAKLTLRRAGEGGPAMRYATKRPRPRTRA